MNVRVARALNILAREGRVSRQDPDVRRRRELQAGCSGPLDLWHREVVKAADYDGDFAAGFGEKQVQNRVLGTLTNAYKIWEILKISANIDDD